MTSDIQEQETRRLNIIDGINKGIGNSKIAARHGIPLWVVGWDARACAEVRNHLPQDLLPLVTVLFQGSGYVSISPRDLSRLDWRRLNEKVRQMGGLWISNDRFSHWSIPFSSSREQ